MNNVLVNAYLKVKQFYCPVNYIYKIEDINFENYKVTLSCRGKGATILANIREIANDTYIINNLPSLHASWIGYYFCKYWKDNKMQLSNFDFNHYLGAQKISSTYKILYQDRKGRLTILNQFNGQQISLTALEIAQSDKIKDFTSLESFYIGFLSYIEKNKRVKTGRNPIKSHLKLVK